MECIYIERIYIVGMYTYAPSYTYTCTGIYIERIYIVGQRAPSDPHAHQPWDPSETLAHQPWAMSVEEAAAGCTCAIVLSTEGAGTLADAAADGVHPMALHRPRWWLGMTATNTIGRR